MQNRVHLSVYVSDGHTPIHALTSCNLVTTTDPAGATSGEARCDASCPNHDQEDFLHQVVDIALPEPTFCARCVLVPVKDQSNTEMFLAVLWFSISHNSATIVSLQMPPQNTSYQPVAMRSESHHARTPRAGCSGPSISDDPPLQMPEPPHLTRGVNVADVWRGGRKVRVSVGSASGSCEWDSVVRKDRSGPQWSAVRDCQGQLQYSDIVSDAGL